jgi:hypothetical protein
VKKKLLGFGLVLSLLATLVANVPLPIVAQASEVGRDKNPPLPGDEYRALHIKYWVVTQEIIPLAEATGVSPLQVANNIQKDITEGKKSSSRMLTDVPEVFGKEYTLGIAQSLVDDLKKAAMVEEALGDESLKKKGEK